MPRATRPPWCHRCTHRSRVRGSSSKAVNAYRRMPHKTSNPVTRKRTENREHGKPWLELDPARTMSAIGEIAVHKVWTRPALLVLAVLIGCEDTAPPTSSPSESAYVGTYALTSANAEATLHISETAFSFAAVVQPSGLVPASNGTQEAFIALEGSANIEDSRLRLSVESARSNQSLVSQEELSGYKNCPLSGNTGEIASKAMKCIGADSNVTLSSSAHSSLEGTWIQTGSGPGYTMTIQGNTFVYRNPGGISASGSITIHPTYFVLRLSSAPQLVQTPEQLAALNGQLANSPFLYVVRGSTLRMTRPAWLGGASTPMVFHFRRG